MGGHFRAHAVQQSRSFDTVNMQGSITADREQPKSSNQAGSAGQCQAEFRDANYEHKSHRERAEVRDITAKMLADAQIGKPQCHEQTDAQGR